MTKKYIKNLEDELDKELEDIEKDDDEEIEEEEETPVKKKRGRKPKPKDPNEVKVPKKRGRKPKNKIGHTNEKHQVASVNEENEKIILHLPIRVQDIKQTKEEENDENYNEVFCGDEVSTDKKPKIAVLDDFIKDKKEDDEDNIINTVDSDEVISDDDEDSCIGCKQKEKKIRDMKKNMKDMKSVIDEGQTEKERKVSALNINMTDIKNGKKIWKKKTNLCCWWCTEPFDTPPLILPEKYNHITKIYSGPGVFCSYNCAAAYSFDLDDGHKVWERYSLIKRMHKESKGLKEDKEVICAPPWQALKKFSGGYLDIDKFRESSVKNETIYRIIMPPMASIVPLIEEDYTEVNTKDERKKLVTMKTVETLKLKKQKK